MSRGPIRPDADRPVVRGRPGKAAAGELPPVRVEPDARRRIRRALAVAGRRIAVLDDDPTGSQTVHDVAWSPCSRPTRYAAGLAAAGSTCFVLTNTRSLPEDDAVELTTSVAGKPVRPRRTLGAPSRWSAAAIPPSAATSSPRCGPSTPCAAQVTGARVRRRAAGAGVLEAGRFTAGDMHWARVGQDALPVERDRVRRGRHLRLQLLRPARFRRREKQRHDRAGRGLRITLTDIREGGPERVAELLAGVTGGAFVVVNATDYADLESSSSGCSRRRRAAGRSCTAAGRRLCRPWPGSTRNGPLPRRRIWPAGRPGGHGLVVVGSHVGLTSRQVAVAQQRGGLTEIELHVPHVARPRPARRPRRRRSAAGR